jgi:hypothetical protein
MPYYTEIVEATVTQRMGIATEAIMSHLSNSILMSHAKLKAEQRSVGRYSPQEMQERAANQIRRLGDQIEMTQYIRGRIGMDRSTALDIGRIPGYHARRWPPSAMSQGQENDQDSPPYSPFSGDDQPLERAPKRSRKQSSSTVMIDSEPFSPVTGSDQDSPVSEGESDVQAKGRPVEVKTEAQAEDLLMAKVAQKLTRRQSTT